WPWWLGNRMLICRGDWLCHHVNIRCIWSRSIIKSVYARLRVYALFLCLFLNPLNSCAKLELVLMDMEMALWVFSLALCYRSLLFLQLAFYYHVFGWLILNRLRLYQFTYLCQHFFSRH